MSVHSTCLAERRLQRGLWGGTQRKNLKTWGSTLLLKPLKMGLPLGLLDHPLAERGHRARRIERVSFAPGVF